MHKYSRAPHEYSQKAACKRTKHLLCIIHIIYYYTRAFDTILIIRELRANIPLYLHVYKGEVNFGK